MGSVESHWRLRPERTCHKKCFRPWSRNPVLQKFLLKFSILFFNLFAKDKLHHTGATKRINGKTMLMLPIPKPVNFQLDINDDEEGING